MQTSCLLAALLGQQEVAVVVSLNPLQVHECGMNAGTDGKMIAQRD